MKKKLTLLLIALVTSMGAWADVLPTAAVGSWMYDASDPFLTLKSSDDATITTDGDGNIIIHASNLCTVSDSRSYAAVVMEVDMPDEAPGAFANFFCLKAADNYTGAIGLGVTTDKKLKGTWGNGEWNDGGGVVTASAVTGEHTIIMLCNNGGTTIYVDDTSTSVNKGGLKCATQWTDLRIESAYKTCVKKVFVFKGEQIGNISSIFSELAAFNLVTVEDEETKAVSDNSSAYFNVATGGTLTVDVADYELNKVFGGGDIVLDANTSLTGGKYTVVTGKLTVNEGKMLTIGGGDSQTNSIASFASIDLAGTIKHNNSKATLNNVTVPSGKTGNIFSYDMGSETDGFKLAGTTTLNGGLVVCSNYNFQMKIDALSGANSLLICGVTTGTFSAEGTESQEDATINIANASGFTGTATLNNTGATINLSGSLVGSTWQKQNGTLNYTGASLNGTTLDGVVLNGSSSRITTSNTVNIKNLAGNNLNNTDHLYAFVGGGTINFYGTCDLTKKSDGTTTCNSANIGYGSSGNVLIKAGANVTAGVVLNSSTVTSNAPITVEATATLTAVGSTHNDNKSLLVYSTNLTNNGTLNLNADGRGSIVSALSGTGTLNVASGSTITAPSVPTTMTLTGAGDVVLTDFPSSTHPTLSSWNGAIEFPAGGSNSTNLTDIFNAWGNESSTIKLNNTSGYFFKTSVVNPTLNILADKTLTISNGYSGAGNYPPVLKELTGAGNMSITWNPGNDNFGVKINELTYFTGMLSTVRNPITVDKLVLAAEPAVDDLLFKTSGTVTLSDIYVNTTDFTDACEKEIATKEDVTGYYITRTVTDEQNKAITAITPYASYLASGVGKYTVYLGSTPYTVVGELNAAIEAWATLSDCVEPIITINQPTSAFYRIKSGSKYLQDARKSDSETQRTLTDAVGANESAETIFYLNDNTFVGYKTGYGFGFSVCQTRDTEHLNTQLFTESAEMGKYTIQSQQGTCASADYNVGYWGVDDSDLFREADAASGACWTIESVTSLPVSLTQVGEHGFASFYTPVAISTLPSGVKAYIASVDGDRIRFTNITDIPANTGVILYQPTYNSDPVNLTIGSASSDKTGNVLQGIVATTPLATMKTTLSASDILTMQNDGTKGLGFYNYTGTNLNGFKAFIKSNDVVGVKSFVFDFDDDDETGILSIDNGKLTIDNAAIYNVAGQRLSKMQKGINIVNGKKILK